MSEAEMLPYVLGDALRYSVAVVAQNASKLLHPQSHVVVKSLVEDTSTKTRTVLTSELKVDARRVKLVSDVTSTCAVLIHRHEMFRYGALHLARAGARTLGDLERDPLAGHAKSPDPDRTGPDRTAQDRTRPDRTAQEGT